MTNKAVIYARVSTKEQGENGHGLTYQIEDCKTYARLHGFEVITILKDDITGATRLEERLGGKQLLELVTSHKIGAVIVWRLDRLVRPPKGEYSRLLTTLEHFMQFGVAVHDCDGGESNPLQLAGGLLAFVKSYQASQEREAIRDRTLKGKQERAKSGQWVGMFAPYGYDKVGERKNAQLMINQQEASIIRLIFEHYVGWNNRKKMSVYTITKMLNEQSIPTPGNKRNMQTRGKWTISNVRERILKNPLFIGKVKSVGHVLNIPKLAIIEEALFEQAQEQIKLNKRRHHRRKQTRFYLMSARFCCHCGKAMVGSLASVINARGEKVYYPYYRCSGRYGDISTNCKQTNLKAGQIDNLVWNWIEGLLQDDIALDEGLDELESRAREQIEPTKKQLTTVQEYITKVDKKIKQLVVTFSDVEDETVVEAMQEQIKMLIAQKESLQREREELELKIENVEITPNKRQQIKALSRQVRERLPIGNNNDKQRLLDALGLEGVLIESEGGLAIKLSCILDADTFCIENQESWHWSRSKRGWGRHNTHKGRGFGRLPA